MPSAEGPPTEGTPTLPQPAIDIAESAGVDRVDRASGASRITLGFAGAPTLELTPLEVEAIAQGSEIAGPLGPDANTRLTVESVRIALGSSSIPATTVEPAANARGPRRGRETLRADKIKSPAIPPDRPSRKR